jgi:UMF1 family MFS transporter
MDRSRPVHAWALYDFASSAYVTTVATALLPAYFAAVVAPDGLPLGGITVPAVSLWGYAVSLASLLVFAATPVLGAMADRGGMRKRFLAVSSTAGGAATVLISLSGPGDILSCLGFFILAHTVFNASIAFYDAFLPDIAAPAERDRVSSVGYAYGYAGGGLNLALSLVLIQGHGLLGLDQGRAVQLAMGLAGVWWLAFSVPSLAGLTESAPSGGALGLAKLVREGFSGAWDAWRAAARAPATRNFLLAYIFYNDGVQTVISMATIYGKQEIGLSEGVLVGTLLGIQAVALAGAMAFSRLAARFGVKPVLLAALAGWTLIAVFGRTITTATGYFILGGAVGVVLGGTQALSRSLYSQLVPREEAAVYFGFFSVLTKLSAILGPLVFAVVRQVTGSARPAILSLVVFFVLGMILLTRVRMDDAHA